MSRWSCCFPCDSSRNVWWLAATRQNIFSHILASCSVTAPDLQVSVCELPLCVSQLSLSVLQALLQGLHLPLHLLLVLSDGHFKLAQLTVMGMTREKKKNYKNAEHAERFCKLNEIYGKICLCLWVCCTRFALCWSSPCLSFSALSISKTSWVLSSNSLWVSLWSHTSTFIEQFIR